MSDVLASSPIPTAEVSLPLHDACLAGNASEVQQLLSGAGGAAAARALAQGADAEGRTPLMLAAALADEAAATAMLSSFLSLGVPVCSMDLCGRTALHWACSKGAAHALLQAGARVEGKDDIGDTPVHTACRAGHDGALLALLESRGVQGPATLLSARNHAGGTPITVAGWQGSAEPEGEPVMDALARERALLCIMQYHPPSRVLVLHHEECLLHENSETHQEAPQRVTAILQEIEREYGTGQGAALLRLSTDVPRASGEAVTRAHSRAYWGLLQAVDQVVRVRGDALAGGLPLTPIVQRSLLDVPANLAKAGSATDTGFRAGTLQASLRAAGSVCRAVEQVLAGQARHALCVVRPPGHHAGINGLPSHSHSSTGPGHASSCGFCILNNVAIGALHALSLPTGTGTGTGTGAPGCKRIAIIDLDAHHGNGTEEIVREWYRKRRAGVEADRSQSILFFSVHLWDEERVPPLPPPPPQGTEGEGAESMTSPPLGHGRRPARAARAGRAAWQGGGGEGGEGASAAGEGQQGMAATGGEGATATGGADPSSLTASASGGRGRRGRSKSNAGQGEEGGGAPASKRARGPGGSGSTPGGKGRARKGSVTSTTSSARGPGRRWSTTALELPPSSAAPLPGWTVRAALRTTCTGTGTGMGSSATSTAAPSSAFSGLPPLLSHPALSSALLPPPGILNMLHPRDVPALLPPPLPVPVPPAAMGPPFPPQGQRQEEAEESEEGSEAEEDQDEVGEGGEWASEAGPAPPTTATAAPPLPQGSPMPPPPPPMVVQVSVDTHAPDAAASWRVEGEPTVGFHAGGGGGGGAWEGESGSRSAAQAAGGEEGGLQPAPPALAPAAGGTAAAAGGRVQFELTMSHAGIGLTPMARSMSVGGAGAGMGGGGAGTPRVAGMARAFSAGGHGPLARHSSYGGGIGASLLVAGAAAGSLASLGGSGGGPPLGTTPLSRSYSGGGLGGSGTRRSAVVGLQISPEGGHATSSTSSSPSSSPSTPGPVGMLDDTVPDGPAAAAAAASQSSSASRPLAPPRLTLARQPSEVDAGLSSSSSAWPPSHGPPTATVLGALSPVGAVNALLARQGVKGGLGEERRARRNLWGGPGKEAQQQGVDGESEGHAPGDLLWAFYPGTGGQDILQDNIINCPLLPLWKDPSAHGHGHGGRGRHSHTGMAGEEAGGSKPTDPPPRSGWKAVRHLILARLLPALRAFSPDLILLSAGFDGCKDDYGNCKNDKVYSEGKRPQGLNLRPEDYAWITERIVEVSAVCCPGRVVSVLEGGYGRVRWKKVQPAPQPPATPAAPAAAQEGEGSGAGAAPLEPGGAGGGRMSTRGGGQGRPGILSPARAPPPPGTGGGGEEGGMAESGGGVGGGPHGLSIDPHAPRQAAESKASPPAAMITTWVMELDREPLAKACCAMLGALVQEGGGGHMASY